MDHNNIVGGGSGFYTGPDAPYTKTTWLDNLGAYSLNPGLSRYLDQAREMVESGQYYYYGVPFPSAGDISIAAGVTFGGVITVPPLSYLLGLTSEAFSFGGGVFTYGAFKFRIFDKGAKMDSMINSQFVKSRLVSGRIHQVPGLSNYPPKSNPVNGIYFLETPMVVLKPGSLQIEVTNLSTSTQYIQMLMGFAVPVNAQSVGNVHVVRGGTQ